MLSCAAAAGLIWLTLADAQTHKQAAKKQPQKTTASAPKKAAASGARKGTSTARSATSSTARKSTAGRRPASKRPAVTWRNRQTVPSSDRYREIQSALVARGYLGPDEATGTWNQASIDALKRFQAEQNLDSSGKINSLSLIALGLGPKRDATVVLPKPQIDQGGQ